MEERRREPRITVDLVVDVWGRDQSGEPFVQPAHARNISLSGALLEGLTHDVRSGDIIGIQRGPHKAAFRVVWAMDSRTAKGMRVAVHKLEGQECPWRAELSVGTHS